MKKFLIACLSFLFSSSAFAQGIPYQGGYIEAFAGISILSDVDTEEFSLDTTLGEFRGRSSIEYGNEFSWGLEAGIDGYPGPNLRIGASWDYINAEFDNVHVTGTLADEPFSDSQFRTGVIWPKFGFGDQRCRRKSLLQPARSK
jgi:hypothetical protein